MAPELTQTFVLLRDWHGGDRRALHRLLERDLPWIKEYVVNRLGDVLRGRADLDDYVHDAAIRALEYSPRFTVSNRDQFRALLARITENRDSAQKLRTAKRDVTLEKPTPSDSMLHLDPPVGEVTRPSQAAARNEERMWIRLAIDLLDPEDRHVVLWREWEDLSFAEIAARLEIKEDAARMRFNRALPKLASTVQALRRVAWRPS